jgi:hypothetical protein
MCVCFAAANVLTWATSGDLPRGHRDGGRFHRCFGVVGIHLSRSEAGMPEQRLDHIERNRIAVQTAYQSGGATRAGRRCRI